MCLVISRHSIHPRCRKLRFREFEKRNITDRGDRQTFLLECEDAEKKSHEEWIPSNLSSDLSSSSGRSDEPKRKEPELVVYETLSQLAREHGQFQADNYLDRKLEKYEKLNGITKTRRKDKFQEERKEERKEEEEEEEESEKKEKPARNPKSG